MTPSATKIYDPNYDNIEVIKEYSYKKQNKK